MKRSFAAFLLVAAMLRAQTVPVFTADYYRVNPERYLGKEVTLAVAYLMPQEAPREDGLRAFNANTYNQNQFGGHIPIAAPPEVATRLAAQCGTQHVWNHSHITFIRGVFMKEKMGDRYYVYVPK